MNTQLKSSIYFSLAKEISNLSKDKHTKHGCIAVSQDGSILSMGYNGPPRKVNDDLVPYGRPQKYFFMEHAERNCIYNAAREGIKLKDCIFFVTGIPCTDCMRAMFQVGASKICYLNVESNMKTTTEFHEFIKDYIEVEIYADLSSTTQL